MARCRNLPKTFRKLHEQLQMSLQFHFPKTSRKLSEKFSNVFLNWKSFRKVFGGGFRTWFSWKVLGEVWRRVWRRRRYVFGGHAGPGVGYFACVRACVRAQVCTCVCRCDFGVPRTSSFFFVFGFFKESAAHFSRGLIAHELSRWTIEDKHSP